MPKAACGERDLGDARRGWVPGKTRAVAMERREVVIGEPPVCPQGDVERASPMPLRKNEVVALMQGMTEKRREDVKTAKVAADVPNTRGTVHVEEAPPL